MKKEIFSEKNKKTKMKISFLSNKGNKRNKEKRKRNPLLLTNALTNSEIKGMIRKLV